MEAKKKTLHYSLLTCASRFDSGCFLFDTKYFGIAWAGRGIRRPQQRAWDKACYAWRGTDMGEFILECVYFGQLPCKEGLVLWAGRNSKKLVPWHIYSIQSAVYESSLLSESGESRCYAPIAVDNDRVSMYPPKPHVME